MFQLLRDPLLRLLKAPAEPPEPPAGTHASVQVFRASPRYLAYRLLGVALGAAAVLIAGSLVVAIALANRETGTAVSMFLAVGVAIVVLVLVYVGVRIDYEVRYYVFTDRSLRVREGAWLVREMTLTFANVQNLRVTQGPLQRLFGISDLRVDTAGGGSAPKKGERGTRDSHTFTVAGVENAAELRDLVRTHQRRHADAGLGDPDDARIPRAPARVTASPALRDALVQVLDAARELRRAAEHAA